MPIIEYHYSTHMNMNRVFDTTELSDIFVDFDGTLFPYQAYDTIVHCDPVTNRKRFIHPEGQPFKHLEPNFRVMDMLSKFPLHRRHLLTVADTSFEHNAKVAFINEYCMPDGEDMIPPENIVSVGSAEIKVQILDLMCQDTFQYDPSDDSYARKHRRSWLLIDDDISIISEAERLGFTVMHTGLLL